MKKKYIHLFVLAELWPVRENYSRAQKMLLLALLGLLGHLIFLVLFKEIYLHTHFIPVEQSHALQAAPFAHRAVLFTSIANR